jgi:hypothetical protein
MTPEDYLDFRRSFNDFLQREELSSLEPGGTDSDEEGDGDDLGFSWQPCECCHRRLGGDRYRASGINNGEIQQYSVCCDCYYYAAYGVLDDDTMISVEMQHRSWLKQTIPRFSGGYRSITEGSEMSLDVYLEVDGAQVYEGNITHALAKMADAYGLFDILWHPKESSIDEAWQLVDLMIDGLERMRADPDTAIEHEPECMAGGGLDYLAGFVRVYLEACQKHPKARVVAYP